MTMARSPAPTSGKQLSELLGLLDEVDGVELKLTILETSTRTASASSSSRPGARPTRLSGWRPRPGRS